MKTIEVQLLKQLKIIKFDTNLLIVSVYSIN